MQSSGNTDSEDTGSPDDSVFSEEWLPVGWEYTYIIKYGKLRPKEPLILIIPGNPGVADYYKEFMRVLHKKSDHQMALWCVSQAGHVTMPSHIPKVKAQGENFRDLEGQIKHKLKFISDYIPSDTPLIMIGHSIGCYMVLKIMESLERERVIQSVFLFPTIERMAISPKGRVFTRMSWLLGSVGHLPLYPLYYLTPNFVRYYMTKMYFMGTVPESAVEATLRLINPSCVYNSIYLARHEMKEVMTADHDLIEKHKDKLMFYYGTSDHWCPLEYAHDMKKAHPDADIHICERGYQHAFVLKDSVGMAELLWDLLAKKMPHTFN